MGGGGGDPRATLLSVKPWEGGEVLSWMDNQPTKRHAVTSTGTSSKGGGGVGAGCNRETFGGVGRLIAVLPVLLNHFPFLLNVVYRQFNFNKPSFTIIKAQLGSS